MTPEALLNIKVTCNQLYRYWRSGAGVDTGCTSGIMMLLAVFIIYATGLSAAGSYPNLPYSGLADANCLIVQDSVPAPVRTSSRKEPFRSATQSEKARTAIILEHTRLGIPPPPEEVLERQRLEQLQKAERRKAEQRALIADRLERRRQRIEMLKNDGSNQVTAANKEKLAQKSREERKRESDLQKIARQRQKRLEKQETIRQRREDQKARLIAKRAAEREEREAEMARFRSKRAAKKAAILAKREAERREQEAKQARLMAKRDAERKAQEAEQARLVAKREAEHEEQEAEQARLAAKLEAERKEQEAEQARLAAKLEAERKEQEAEQASLVAEREAEQEKKDNLVAKGEIEQIIPPVNPSGPGNADKGEPNPSPTETARSQWAEQERTKYQRERLMREQKALAARQKREQREARIADRESRGERSAARKEAMRKAAADRLAQRQARQEVLRQRRAEMYAVRELRLADRAEKKSARLAERSQLKENRMLARTERLAARDQRKSENMAARERRRAAALTNQVARKDLRDKNRAEKLAAREARRNDQLALRESLRAAKLAKQAERKSARDLRRSEKMAAREARRNDRLAKKEFRRAERLARRMARRADRLARREARRLRRQQNPPYWTAEPAVAIGLAARSGGPGGEKSLEAVTVQGLVGYHRAQGLSLRTGMAATVINSKVSKETTTTETISQTAVVRIIQNPDGSQTQEMGTVQVQQTTVRKERYYNRLNSVDLPVLLGYRIPGNRFGLLIEAGPSLNLSSGGAAHLRNGEGFQATGSGHFLGRRPGIGFVAMMTGEYQLSNTATVIGGLRLQSFGRAFENPEVSGNATRVTTLSLQLGYRMRF